jgi:hypothetical protein
MNVRTTASVCNAIHLSNNVSIVLAETDHQQVAVYTTNPSIQQKIASTFADTSPRTHTVKANTHHPRVFIVIIPGIDRKQIQQALQRI